MLDEMAKQLTPPGAEECDKKKDEAESDKCMDALNLNEEDEKIMQMLEEMDSSNK